MLAMMGGLALFAMVVTAIYPNKTPYLDRVILWIGLLWFIVFGAMFLNELARYFFASRVMIWASSTWQPFGPMLVGLILLWARWRAKHENEAAGS